jgi:hypothetical protein
VPDPDDALAADEPASRRRALPLPVNVASIAAMFVAALGFYAAIGYFVAAGDEEFLADNNVGATSVVVTACVWLVVSAVQLVAAVLVRRRHRVARALLLVLAGLQFISALLLGAIIFLVVDGAILYCLLFPASTKEFFAGPAPAEAG